MQLISYRVYDVRVCDGQAFLLSFGDKVSLFIHTSIEKKPVKNVVIPRKEGFTSVVSTSWTWSLSSHLGLGTYQNLTLKALGTHPQEYLRNIVRYLEVVRYAHFYLLNCICSSYRVCAFEYVCVEVEESLNSFSFPLLHV